MGGGADPDETEKRESEMIGRHMMKKKQRELTQAHFVVPLHIPVQMI